MKKVYCFFNFCSFFLTSSKKAFYNLKINKISNIGSNKIYNVNDNYNYFEKSRNNEYEDILDEIISEYEEKKKKEKEDNIGRDKIITNLQENRNNSNGKEGCNSEKKESQKRNEIKRIEQQKENNILNLCNLNYDLLNILLNKELEENKITDEADKQYNKVSLFLESQAHNKNKNMYIDDSVGRYFLNIDEKFINTISERELHILKNEIYKNIIYLKYKYLKSYKSMIHELKQIKQNKTEEINKHVSIVHEDDSSEETTNINDDGSNNKNYTEYNNHELNTSKNSIDKKKKKEEINNYTDNMDRVSLNDTKEDHTDFSNLETYNYNLEHFENIDKKLSMENLKEIIDVKQKILKLQENFDNLKNFNIGNILNKNKFLNGLNKHNFNFLNYNSSLLSKSMNNFVKKIRRDEKSKDDDKQNKVVNDVNRNKTNNSYNKEEENNILKDVESNYSYICTPKITDYNFFKKKSRSIIINLSNHNDDKKKDLLKVSELNVDTNKGVLLLSGNEKNLNVCVRNICDKISYLTQSFTIYPQINYKEDISKNKKIIMRILILMLFYFNIKNMYVICLDNTSAHFFYEIMKSSDNNLLTNFCKGKKEEYLFVHLNEIKFSHLFNYNFVPSYSIRDIFKNHVFMMNKEQHLFDINFFKRSCLFIFLDEHINKKNHAISSSVQHFFYYKKFDYPYIYNIDNKYSLNTLKKFNEILLYLTAWIEIFHTGENESDSKNFEELTDEETEYDETKDEEEISENLNTNDDDDENYDEEEDEREVESHYGKDLDSNEEDRN